MPLVLGEPGRSRGPWLPWLLLEHVLQRNSRHCLELLPVPSRSRVSAWFEQETSGCGASSFYAKPTQLTRTEREPPRVLPNPAVEKLSCLTANTKAPRVF